MADTNLLLWRPLCDKLQGALAALKSDPQLHRFHAHVLRFFFPFPPYQESRPPHGEKGTTASGSIMPLTRCKAKSCAVGAISLRRLMKLPG
jgi:hypothetical protein